jgi:tRNA A37 threonylcarbamoyladenosine dehydratase
MHPFHRTELLVGSEGFARLQSARVCVIGLGGVGSYAAEALARSAVGHLTLVDFDSVCVTNLNRQLHAVRGTVGKSKAELMGERVRDIHPGCDVRVIPKFYGPDTADEILDGPYDAVLDCIDNMTAKLHLLERCVAEGRPVWSAMGAGGRMDPTRVKVSDISETRIDPFARIVRQGLRERGIETGIHAIWSDEHPNDLDAAVQAGFRCICPDRANSPHSCDRRLQVQGSVAWMPSMFGLAMAGAVANTLLGRTLQAPKPDKRHGRQRPATDKPSRARKKELMAAAGLLDIQPMSRRAYESRE